MKFNSDDKLPLNKILKIHSTKMVIRSAFQEDGNYYLPDFSDECFDKL